MCAIIDASVAHKIARPSRSEAGSKFLDCIDAGLLQIVVGGKLRNELYRTSMQRWVLEALRSGRARSIDDNDVNEKTEELIESGECVSDDHHIIALGQISGARLLFSNDKKLHTDFKNKNLIDKPRGKIYTTLNYEYFHDSHKRLLDRRDLCQTG